MKLTLFTMIFMPLAFFVYRKFNFKQIHFNRWDIASFVSIAVGIIGIILSIVL